MFYGILFVNLWCGGKLLLLARWSCLLNRARARKQEKKALMKALKATSTATYINLLGVERVEIPCNLFPIKNIYKEGGERKKTMLKTNKTVQKPTWCFQYQDLEGMEIKEVSHGKPAEDGPRQLFSSLCSIFENPISNYSLKFPFPLTRSDHILCGDKAIYKEIQKHSWNAYTGPMPARLSPGCPRACPIVWRGRDFRVILAAHRGLSRLILGLLSPISSLWKAELGRWWEPRS